MKTSDDRPRRRFFQFSLRSLFALMLLAAVLCGTFGVRTVYVRDQRAVADRLLEVTRRSQGARAGAATRTTIDWDDVPSYLGMQPHPWVRSLLGDDFYRNVVGVSLRGDRQLTDDDLVLVSRLDHLRRLDLNFTAITDEGLRHLGTLPQLKTLDISSTDVSSDGLRHLDNTPELISLGLGFTMIDDEGIAHLVATHLRLERLDLTNTSIGDASLAALARCEQLDTLIICDTDVTAAGLTELGELKHLRVVALNNTAIDDQAMGTLAALPALEELYLRHTAVSDAGMKSLATADKLRVLQICGTDVTDAGIADVARIGTLQTLDVRGLGVTDAGIAPLAGLKLKLLLVQNTSVTPIGLARLANLPERLEKTLIKVLTKTHIDRATRTVTRYRSTVNPGTLEVHSIGGKPLEFPRLKLRERSEDARLRGDFSMN